jgi:hypothetical protein
MAKRMVENQIWKTWSNDFELNMWYNVGKVSSRVKIFPLRVLQSKT